MAKKVLIISTSLRGGSNSEILANECAEGAKEAGHDVELLSLKGKDIKYCIGCLSCQRTGMCVLKDDVADIMAKVKNAEVIVYATPIYYYEMCGQMKTLLDRLNPLYSTDYSFRDIYMIATAAENDESAFEKAYNGLQGWGDCLEKTSLKGMVGGGIDAANRIPTNTHPQKQNAQYFLAFSFLPSPNALEITEVPPIPNKVPMDIKIRYTGVARDTVATSKALCV